MRNVLLAIARGKGDPVSRRQIGREVWGSRAPDASLTVHVYRLRQRFGKTLILTVTGGGYRINLAFIPD